MNISKKYSTLAIILLPLVLLMLMMLYPLLGITFGIVYFLIGTFIIGYSIYMTHKEKYLRSQISRGKYFFNNLVEMIGILLAFILAVLMGRYLAVIGTRQIDHEIIRLIAGLVIGLLAGAAIGALVRGVSNRMVRN